MTDNNNIKKDNTGKEIVCYEPPEVVITTFDEKDHIMTSGGGGAWDWLEHDL